jgi:CheY-like chemotaxis protein
MDARRVLIVDDEADGRESLRMVVALWGYEAIEAGGGSEALTVILASRPDIVVMDLGMPDPVRSCEVIAQIKKADPNTIVIAFTGYHRLEDAAFAAGADGFVLKPDVDGLERQLAYQTRLLRSRAAMRTLRRRRLR